MTGQSIPKFPAELVKQVREACKHYDKPKRIGKLPLATVALQSVLLENPDHPTNLIGRGEALEHVIDVNLDKLKPIDRYTHEGEIYLCLYCYTHERDPYDGTQIGQFGAYLKERHQIPVQTGQYRIREGIPLLSYQISHYLAKDAWVEATPDTPNFVGREEQLAYYRTQLEQDGLAVIQGAGGIGKSALAAQVAESIKIEAKRPVCWITIRPGLNDSVSGVLYGWAAFLAKHGYPQLWAFMRATASEEKKVNDFFPHLLVGFGEIEPLLCLDNLEVIPKSKTEFWSLLSMVQEKSKAILLLTSQQRPPLAGLNDYSKLSGLAPSEVEQLIKPHEMELTGEQINALTLYSSGNPRLINLWIAHVRVQDSDRAGLFPVESEITSDFLLPQIISALSEGQQRAALLLALSRRPLDRFLLQTSSKQLRPLSDLEIEPDYFMALQRVGIISDESANQWTVLPLLKEYLADQATVLPFADEIIDFHQWLADLYLLQANVMEAAYHAIEGGQAERALLWLARQQHSLIEQGQAAPMSTLLDAIPADELSGPRKRLLHNLRIELSQLLGDYNAAEREIKAAQESSLNIDDDAYLKQMRGELTKRRGHVQQAADHYQEALQLLSTKHITLDAWLHRDLAWVLMQQNDLSEAWHETERAQMELHNTFGSIARRQGKLDLAISHFEQAIAYGQERGEHRRLTRVYNNLALTYWGKEQFKEAIATFQTNLKVIEEIGELVGKAITLLNIGVCYTQIGLDEPEKAITYFAQALPMFTTLGDVRGLMLANSNLGEQYMRLGELNIAQRYAKRITEIDEAQVPPSDYAESLRVYAEILLAQGNLAEALSMAKQALNKRRVPGVPSDRREAYNDPFQTKFACETLVKIHEALGDTAEAERYRSLTAQLEERGRVERPKELTGL